MIYKRFCGNNTRSFLNGHNLSHFNFASGYVRDTHCRDFFFCFAKLTCHENFKLKVNWAEPAFDMQTQPDFESESMRELPLTQQYY